MRRVVFGFLLSSGAVLALGACESAPPSWDLLAPYGRETPAPAPVAGVAPGPAPAVEPATPPKPGEFDFNSDSREGEGEKKPEGEKPDEVSLQAKLLGLSEVPPDTTGVQPAGLAPGAPPPGMTRWDARSPVPGSWGLRVLSTIEAWPPRAVLGLPDGREIVVQAGALVPEAGVVVLAIGKDVVQVAEIVPNGDHARVETRYVPAMVADGSRPAATLVGPQ